MFPLNLFGELIHLVIFIFLQVLWWAIHAERFHLPEFGFSVPSITAVDQAADEALLHGADISRDATGIVKQLL